MNIIALVKGLEKLRTLPQGAFALGSISEGVDGCKQVQVTISPVAWGQVQDLLTSLGVDLALVNPALGQDLPLNLEK